MPNLQRGCLRALLWPLAAAVTFATGYGGVHLGASLAGKPDPAPPVAAASQPAPASSPAPAATGRVGSVASRGRA